MFGYSFSVGFAFRVFDMLVSLLGVCCLCFFGSFVGGDTVLGLGGLLVLLGVIATLCLSCFGALSLVTCVVWLVWLC